MLGWFNAMHNAQCFLQSSVRQRDWERNVLGGNGIDDDVNNNNYNNDESLDARRENAARILFFQIIDYIFKLNIDSPSSGDLFFTVLCC